ncbi:unnamed protein product, partial [Tetraodon nigroviridis]
SSLGPLYFTYGVVFACGCSFSYQPSLVILGHYFKRRLGLVNGIVTAGSSIFTIVLPFVLVGPAGPGGSPEHHAGALRPALRADAGRFHLQAATSRSSRRAPPRAAAVHPPTRSSTSTSGSLWATASGPLGSRRPSMATSCLTCTWPTLSATVAHTVTWPPRTPELEPPHTPVAHRCPTRTSTWRPRSPRRTFCCWEAPAAFSLGPGLWSLVCVSEAVPDGGTSMRLSADPRWNLLHEASISSWLTFLWVRNQCADCWQLLMKHVEERFGPETNKEVLLLCIGITSCIGRFIFGRVADYVPGVKKVYLQVTSFFVIGLMSMMIPLCNVFGGLIAVCLLMGLFDGCFISIMAPIAFELVGANDVSQAIGFLLGLMSVPMTVGPPVAGFLRDRLGSYDVAFYLAGIPPIFGGALLCLIPWVEAKRRR